MLEPNPYRQKRESAASLESVSMQARSRPWGRWKSIGATLLLGVVASGAWDILKPGLSRFWDLALVILTLGSQKVYDRIFAMAALDPRPIPSLVTLYLFIVLLASFLAYGAGRTAARLHAAKRGFGRSSLRRERRTERVEKSKRRMFGIRVEAIRGILSRETMLIGASTLVSVFFLALFLYVNRAVGVWRVFHANLSICAPYISEEERVELKARFAGMTSAREFDEIETHLRRVAEKAGVSLRELD